MNFPHKNSIPFMVFICLLFISLSCSKDSDLLADYVKDDPQFGSVRRYVVDDSFVLPPTGSTSLDVLANDNFPEEEEVKITETSDPPNGTVTINPDNTVTYTADDPQTSTDTFTYTAEVSTNDTSVSSETGTVTIAASGGTILELNALKAFPSAQGHGSDIVTGGAGGTIFYVNDLGNNTNGSYDPATNTHTGSFKYALRHSEPGYIVFRVAGVIEASTENDYLIQGPNLGNKTIMGGTAPYPGLIFNGHRFMVAKTSGNWIIRGITFLAGGNLPANKYKTFAGQDERGIILSDNTFGWATDEGVGFDDSDKILIQRNFFIEGHPEHNTGAVLHVDNAIEGARSMSFHNNGFVHVSHRFPNLSGQENDYFDVVNNVAFNPNLRVQSIKINPNLNDINNYYKKGPRTGSLSKKYNADEYGSPYWATPFRQFYSKGNVISPSFEDSEADNKSLWNQHITAKGFISGDPLPSDFFTNTMHPLGLDVHIKSALASYNYNMLGKNMGSRYIMDSNGKRQKYIPPFIDAYFEDAIKGTDRAYLNNASRFILPAIPSSAAPYADVDFDGMADEWEKEHGLIVGDADHEGIKRNWVLDGTIFINNAGYTNIQMFNDYVHGGFIVLMDQ